MKTAIFNRIDEDTVLTAERLSLASGKYEVEYRTGTDEMFGISIRDLYRYGQGWYMRAALQNDFEHALEDTLCKYAIALSIPGNTIPEDSVKLLPSDNRTGLVFRGPDDMVYEIRYDSKYNAFPEVARRYQVGHDYDTEVVSMVGDKFEYLLCELIIDRLSK